MIADEIQLGAPAEGLAGVVSAKDGDDAATVGRRPGVVRMAIMLGGVGVVVGLVISQRERLVKSGEALTTIDWRWMVAAVAAEAVSMMAFALVHRRLLQVGDARLSVRAVTAVAYASNAISSSIPLAGSEIGTAYTFNQLQRRGADRVTSGWVLAMSGIAASLTFAIVVSVAAVGSGDEWAVVSGAAGSILLAAGFGLLFLVTRQPRLKRSIEEFAVRAVGRASRLTRRTVVEPEQLVKGVLERVSTLRPGAHDWLAIGYWSILNWLADALCLAIALSAFHSQLRWSQLILAWAAGATVSSFQVTPGGLGVVEPSLITALVLAGAPVGHATAAVLLYRLVSYWMVVLTGWIVFIYQRRIIDGSRRVVRTPS